MFFVKRSLNKLSRTDEILFKGTCLRFLASKHAKEIAGDEENEDRRFRVLQIKPQHIVRKEKKFDRVNRPPRTDLMSPDQDWPNVWPGPRTFHPAVVPLPIRQGVNTQGAAPDKYVNLELMKIPNFLHLTPKAIERHCNAIKQFCTPWPENLNTEEEMEQHFPVEIITSDYCHSSPSIRDPSARIVSLKLKLSVLNLNEHARDKFLRLVGPRYDPKTDVITITTDSCPRRYQNYDYAHYLITALYYEAWKFEEWEKDRVDEDHEKFVYEKRGSKLRVEGMFSYNNRKIPDTRQYAEAIENYMNDDVEKAENIERYKEAVVELLSLPKFEEREKV